MRLISPILLLLSINCTASNLNAQHKQSELFLVGGGLKTCSSMSKKQCLESKKKQISQNNDVKKSALFQLNQETKRQVVSLLDEQFQNNHAQQLKILLNKAIKSPQKHIKTKRELINFLKDYDSNNLINRLSDHEYYILLDALEVAQKTNSSNERLKEAVYLNQSKNTFSTNIYLEFVARAKALSSKKTPNILVITASARDSFEAVDFYLQAFQQAGANSQWLPIDASLQSLLTKAESNRAKLCNTLPQQRLKIQKSAFRKHIYPDLYQQQYQACLQPATLISQISHADGIFINGGDQSLTRQALIKDNGEDSTVMAHIRQRFHDDNIVIGGTSAGTAVMSGGMFHNTRNVMITSGESKRAVFKGAIANLLPIEGCQKSNNCKEVSNDDLTYHSLGGLALFTAGILDTHFSERGRQGRLAKLVIDTNAHFAFGVDEATALITKQDKHSHFQFNVVGESGIFIVENSLTQTSSNKVITHYLHQGDRANLMQNGTLTVTFSNDKIKTNLIEQNIPIISQIFDRDNYMNSTRLLCLSANKAITGDVEYEREKAKVYVTKLAGSQSKQGLYQYGNKQKHHCSYSNYLLEIPYR